MSTTEVAECLHSHPHVDEANVYGTAIPGMAKNMYLHVWEALAHVNYL